MIQAKVCDALQTTSNNSTVNIFSCLPFLPALRLSNSARVHVIASVDETTNNNSRATTLNTHQNGAPVEEQNGDHDVGDSEEVGSRACVICCDLGSGKICLCSTNIEVSYADVKQHFPEHMAVISSLQKTVFARDCLFQSMMEACGVK